MSRLDRLKEQHPDLNISLIDIISYLDPTDSYKYIEFLIKNFKRDSQYYSPNKEEFMGYMGVFLFGSGEIETLNEFERHSKANRIKIKDIGQYTNFLELNESVVLAQEIENRKKLEKEILKIHEDDTWLILTPLSFEASQAYGANTKWCVTQERYWKQYLTTHRLIYVLNKKTDTKIAFSREFSTEKFQAWDQLDTEVDPMFVNFIPDELFLKIRKELQKDETTGDLIGWGDDVSTIRRRISEHPEVITNENNGILTRAEVANRLWSQNTQRPTDDDISSLNFSNSMLDRIRRLMGQSNQTISDDRNYIGEYNQYLSQYLDDLP